MDQPRYLLAARSIVKRFGPTSVLNGFDISIAPGEVHAFLGGNGAGKSTLIKIISGQFDRDGGTLEFDGQDIGASASSHVADGSLAVVNQELALLPHLTVAENIAMPRLRRGTARYSERASMTIAIEALSLIDAQFAQVSAGRLVGDLTLHERQLVEIARALGSGAKLLLLDEPTANLTAAETTRLFAVIRRLIADTGLAVLFVSHRMREIRQIADVCTIIRDGKTAVDRAAIDAITDREIVECMGQSIVIDEAVANIAVTTEIAQPANVADHAGHQPSQRNAGTLRIERDGISVDVSAGSIIGLAGAPLGPSSLIDALTGIAPVDAWNITRDGKRINYPHPCAGARDGVGFVSGDRSNKGVLATLPIVDNLVAAARVVSRRGIVRHAEVEQATQLLDALKIRAGSLWDLPATLSGGTQQKLLIARWLLLRPKLLVLEEPTRGVDIRTKREIYALIRKMAQQGTTIIWWSTEYVELVELCDTVLAFDLDGKPTDVLRHTSVNETQLATSTGMAA
ncbi:monosaccharide ABC transporter ATP-binding protein, CUT2 family [Paraburkholderia fungorum]|uniref:Monosaccharide ABC transporter ATP-binding protein, CUT2 family n=1 Tax=Paraburkholderia fungorum TaxID=134537 RepID=A0A1H1JQ05_9BURK|nr:sugar ABC transporter ATP-binding protein [Paraburkholderia fungorum]SDR52098.1 monosaccharide ABC transporter ATP-binding protein, CUT2 family [Paraburkholderia fungorum]